MTCVISSGICTGVSPTSQAVAGVFSAISASAVIAISGSAALNTFGSQDDSSRGVVALRITKLAALIRYININFPYPAEQLFESFSVSQKSMQSLLLAMFGSHRYNQTMIGLPSRFVKFEDTSLFLKNAGNTIILAVVIVIAIGFTRVLLHLARRKKRRDRINRLLKLQIILEWNYILGWIMGTYPDLIFGIGLQISALSFSNPNILSGISSIVCILIAPFAILFPGICYSLMLAGKHSIKRNYHSIMRYESLTASFKENNTDTKLFQILGLLRIQAMVFPLVYWQSNALAQILFMIISSLMVNIFHLMKIGHKSKFTNFVTLGNEILLFAAMIGVLLQIIFLSSGMISRNQHLADVLGWVIASILLVIMIFNAVVSVLGVIKSGIVALKSAMKSSKVSARQRVSDSSKISLQRPTSHSIDRSANLPDISRVKSMKQKRKFLRPLQKKT